ncbi:aminotransferase class V-fold PLP-dependent enzyme [Paenibacillus sp.]|uniref:aminotransferase class V-fold PLP-dependent enzyme n=1 Tax=Paenibacillus sp. TaxID=58172 RepID=UPI002D306132|nr:aminotransferase class V-fold PLP-dependent enzyme [Paenibacillus sp.]HZG84893.1 aminotransferase class V-fold PLP-dependent enzyme [Paenibacillus sp.]
MDVYYFDNAASSWPKPPGVAEAMVEAVTKYGANPGRGSHKLAVEASRAIFRTRKKLATLFGIRNPNDIAFALNTTAALNTAILGYVKEGDHVVCTAVEHNSVRRPLEWLKETRNVRVTYVETSESGQLDPIQVKRAVEPQTRLIVVNHSSNLLGSIVPLAEIGDIARSCGAALLVDAAQSAGVLPIDVEAMGVDMLAFPGHKALYGPQGTGGLYISPKLEVAPLVVGGTGSQSEAVLQPTVRPDRYESGTQNTPGIAGLGAGVDFVLHETIATIHNREWGLTQRMMEGLMRLDGIRLLGPKLGEPRTGIVAFTAEGIGSAEISFVLDQHFRIAVRAGYHCTPLAHRVAGTEATGAVRASVGAFTTDDQVDYFVDAVGQIVREYRGKA